MAKKVEKSGRRRESMELVEGRGVEMLCSTVDLGEKGRKLAGW